MVGVDSQLEVRGREHWPVLFSPYALRGRTVRNRIVSTPHSTGWGHDGLVDAGRSRLPRAQGRGWVWPGDDVRVGLGGPAQRRLVRLHLAVGRAQRRRPARPGEPGARQRGPDHVADDPHGSAGELADVRGGAQGRVGSPRGCAPRGSGRVDRDGDRRARRALRRLRPPPDEPRVGRRGGDLPRRAPDRAVLRPVGQRPDRPVRGLAGEPRPVRPGGAGRGPRQRRRTTSSSASG